MGEKMQPNTSPYNHNILKTIEMKILLCCYSYKLLIFNVLYKTTYNIVVEGGEEYTVQSKCTVDRNMKAGSSPPSVVEWIKLFFI